MQFSYRIQAGKIEIYLKLISQGRDKNKKSRKTMLFQLY
jgi:hypothetical protein